MKSRHMLVLGCMMVLTWQQVAQAQSPQDGRMTGGATTRPVSDVSGPGARPAGAGRALGHLSARPMAGVNRYDASGRRIGQSIPRPPGGSAFFDRYDRYGRRVGHLSPPASGTSRYDYNYYPR